MQRIEQLSFQALPATSQSAEESLLVHAHRSRTNEKLLIFVHGLGGDRYRTWGEFPRLVFDNFPAIDIGLYSYRTLLRRWKVWKSISINREAELFGDQIRDELGAYSNIIFLNHSLGGILCYSVIAYLINSNQKDVLRKFSGLILAGTPQTGSLRVPFFASWLSSDFRALKAHGQLVQEKLVTLTNHVKLNIDDKPADAEIVIPTWAMLGQHDLWVDPLSARVGLPNSRVRHLKLSHTEIVKPVDEHSPSYVYAANCLEKMLARIVDQTGRIPYDASPKEEVDPSQTQLPAPSTKNFSDWVIGALDRAERATARGEDAMFEGPEGIGKSTALGEFLARSRMAGKRTALIHFSAFSQSDLESPGRFWPCLANSLREYLRNTTKMEIEEPSGTMAGQGEFFNYVYYDLPDELYPLVIGIDEVGRLRGRTIEDDFHRMRRVIIDQTRGNPGVRKVQLALCGIEIAKELMTPDRSESTIVDRPDPRSPLG